MFCFPPIRSAGVIFYSYGLCILQQCLLPEVTFIQTFDGFYGMGVSWTPALWNQNGIDSGAESPESPNRSFLVNRNRNRFLIAILCWNQNRNQLQFFRGESESIPVSWNQAQVCKKLVLFSTRIIRWLQFQLKSWKRISPTFSSLVDKTDFRRSTLYRQ